MGKRRKLSQRHVAPNHAKPHKGGAGGGGGPKGQPETKPRKKSSAASSANPHESSRAAQPVLPFAPEDRILLVGEGDLSFAAALVEHHVCLHVTATVLEKNLAELVEKYPHVVDSIAKIEAEGAKVLYNVDATRNLGPFVDKKGKEGVGIMDRIIFNFPHVGGKSTDVNRQVRYNQELLVAFFHRALASLAPGGTIIVTLFEGEPYTLWNIRDLGRHSGLQIERSFKFHASAYPGYHHARTLGVLRSKTGQVGGGWKGEDRPARSYVFRRKDEEPSQQAPRKAKKRSRGHDDESSDDE